jgi:hypothetical protein
MTAPLTVPARERLPNRRASETFNFEVGGLRYCATIARFEDGRIGEIFLASHKAGSQADTAARDSAIVVRLPFSMALTSKRSSGVFVEMPGVAHRVRSAVRSISLLSTQPPRPRWGRRNERRSTSPQRQPPPARARGLPPGSRICR